MAPVNSLKIGIGGVRGVAGETFTPEPAVAFAQAFGTYLDAGRILNATRAGELLDIFHQGEFSKATWRHIRSGVGSDGAGARPP